jgi:E3 ubiquitin-protein ligase HUWE1
MPVLLAFHAQGGLDVLNGMLRAFSAEMCKEPRSTPEEPKSKVASFGLRKILDLYACFVNGKIISDSAALFSLLPRTSDRRPDAPVAQQLTVEFRAAILPVAREIWDSPLIEQASDAVLHGVMDILKSISAGDHEPNGHRGDKVCSRTYIPSASFV